MKIQIDKKSGILKLSNYQSVSTIESFESFERHFLSNLFIYWPHLEFYDVFTTYSPIDAAPMYNVYHLRFKTLEMVLVDNLKIDCITLYVQYVPTNRKPKFNVHKSAYQLQKATFSLRPLISSLNYEKRKEVFKYAMFKNDREYIRFVLDLIFRLINKKSVLDVVKVEDERKNATIYYVMFEKGPGAYFVSIRSIFNKPVAFTNVADVTFVEEQAWENKYDVQTKQIHTNRLNRGETL